jgi:general stress protein 26
MLQPAQACGPVESDARCPQGHAPVTALRLQRKVIPSRETPMASDAELKAKFWKALDSDRTAMLGLQDADTVHPRPMTAQVEGEHGPIWFFTANDTDLAEAVTRARRSVLTFASKGHDLFATVHGDLRVDNDRAAITRLWNPFAAAWFEDGEDDPKLTLLRFDPDEAEIWLSGSSVVAGVKALLHIDPKQDYQDKVSEVRLD